MRTIEEELERVDRWLDGSAEVVAEEVLRQRGFVVKPLAGLSDARVRRALSELITALADGGIFLDATDHLSDRELYAAILSEVLPRAFSVADGDWDVHDFVASEEGFEARMAYYADEQTRASYAEWTSVPPRRALPYDRDRRLPRPVDWEMCRFREYRCGDEE